MSVKLFVLALLSVICLSQAAMLRSKSGTISMTRKTVRSAGSLRTVSRQDDEDEYFDDSEYPEEYSDEDYEDEEYPEEELDFEEPEPVSTPPPVKTKPAPTPAPAPKPTSKPTPKPEPKSEVPKPKLHMEYTMKYPTDCKCVLQTGTNNGVCYEYTTGKKCKGRKCKPSHVCIDGKAPPNAVTCMRKKNTKQIVSNGDGTCKTKEISAYAYKPYSS